MRKTFVLALLGAILLAGGPVDAMPVTAQACQKKNEACGIRCQQKYADVADPVEWSGKALACLSRTCDRQYKNCMDSVTTSGGGGKMTQPQPDPLTPKGGDTRGPF